MKPKPKKKRLVRGKDFVGWMFLPHPEWYTEDQKMNCIYRNKPSWKPDDCVGKWVRVKFMEVES